MGGVTIEINDAPVLDVLSKIAEKAHTAEPALNRIAGYLRTSEQERFDQQVSPDGVKWQALSPRYEAWKRRHNFPGGILTLYGHLRSEWASDITGNVLLFGTDKAYARIHQFGGDIEHQPRSGMMLRGLKGGKLISRQSASKKSRAGFTFQSYDRGGWTQHVPARPFFGLSEQDKAEILDICQTWLNNLS